MRFIKYKVYNEVYKVQGLVWGLLNTRFMRFIKYKVYYDVY